MADGTVLNSGSGGDTIATDDVSDAGVANGQKVQRVKAGLGTDNAYADPLGGTGVDAAGVQRVSLATDIPLPAGTNEIGKLAAGTAVVGEVTIGAASTAAGDLAKAEDAAHTSGDVGVMALAVRNDLLAELGQTDGDYAPLQVDAKGAVYQNQGNFTSTNNSMTSASLTSGLSLTGTSEDVSKYGRVGISVGCDTAADGVLEIYVSHDNSAWYGPISRSWANTSIAEPHTWNIVEKYFRITYVNGTTTATNISIQTQYSNNADIVLAHQLDSTLLDETESQVVRALMVGQDPDDAYINIGANSLGALDVEPEQHVDIDGMNALLGGGGTWAAFDGDTTNLGTSLNHVSGTNSLTFDKANTAANNTEAGIEKTLTALDFGDISVHDILQTVIYLPALTNVTHVFLRLGTDSTNYNEWQIPVASLTAAVWEVLVFNVGDADYAGNTGNGWDATAVTYVAIGVAYDTEARTATGIQFDQISFHTNIHTAAALNSEVTTSVSSSNVNIQKVGNSVTATDAGASTAGTQRMTLASDDPAVTALEIIDNAISGNEMQVDIITSALPTGAATSAAQLADGHTVALSATDNAVLDTIDAAIDTMSAKFAGGTVIGDVNLGATDNAVLDTINTAVELIDNSIVAHDAAASGATGLNVAGARATSSVEGITEVASADVSHLATDLTGVLITRPYIATQEHVQYHIINTAGTELAVTGLDAGGAGIHNFITSIIVHNSHATTMGFIQLLDGSGGTPFITVPAPATGGSVINLPQPLKQPTANTICYWDASAAITSLYVTIIGYQGQG